MLEKTLASPLDCKEIQPVHPIGNDAEAPILWPTDAKTQFIRKDPDAMRD